MGPFYQILPYTFLPTKTLKSKGYVLYRVFPEYIEAVLSIAIYTVLEDGEYFGLVPGLIGIMASGKTFRECRRELAGNIEEWIVTRLKAEQPIPPVGGCKLEDSFGPDVIR
jgi:predicted RNase H-like HicB family nuclease